VAASAAELQRLIEGYQEGLTRLAGATETAAEHRWVRSGSLGRRAITEALDDLDVITRAGRDASTRLAASFVDSYVAAATGTTPAVDPINIDELLDQAPSPRPEYRRIAGDAATARRGGMTATEALVDTAPRVGTIADVHVTDGAVDGFAKAMTRHPQVTKFLRHPEPTACAFCAQISTRTYYIADLQPVHPHCHCVTVPLLDSDDPQGPPRTGGGDDVQPIVPPSWMAPAERSRPIVHAVSFSSARSHREFGPLVSRLARLHGLPDDGVPVMNVVSADVPPRANLRGRLRVPSLRATDPTPELTVYEDGDALTFLHEFGHRVDRAERNGAIRRVSESTIEDSVEVQGAFLDLLEAARTESFEVVVEHFRGVDPDYATYLSSPKEVWARAYAQWAAPRVGAERALSGTLASRPGYQWPTAEFEQLIAPQVEAVLRARGLMT